MKESFINIAKRFDYLHLLVLLISILCCKHYLGHTISPLYDIGREIMYPAMINEGNVLYKDIFCLFGPFSYMFTALLYKIFGATLHTYLIIGCTSALLIVSGIYNITKVLINKNIAFVLSIFTIVTGVANINFCNASYTVPYSMAVVYGLAAFVWSVYFLIKSVQKENNLFLLLSSFLGGIAVCSKYEFALYAIMIFLYIFREFFKKNKKTLILALFAMCIPTFVCLGILFLQGLTISELFNAFVLVKNIAQTPFYQAFYREFGMIFCLRSLKIEIIYFCKFSFIVGLYFAILKICKYNWQKIIFMLLAILLTVCFKNLYINDYLKIENIFAFLPILTIIVAIFNFRKFDKVSKLFILSAILISYKVLWRLSLFHYGAYFAPLLIIALLIMTKDELRKAILVFVCVMTLILFNDSLYMHKMTSTIVNTKSLPIYTDMVTAKKINKTVRYIEKNTQPEDKVVIYPEGLLINFIAERATDAKYYALNPEQAELYGEEKIIKHFKETPPEYFIFIPKLNISKRQYVLCEDYGKNFCDFVNKNYSKKLIFNFLQLNVDTVTVYKKIR